MEIDLGNGYYEVVPAVPEPATYHFRAYGARAASLSSSEANPPIIPSRVKPELRVFMQRTARELHHLSKIIRRGMSLSRPPRMTD